MKIETAHTFQKNYAQRIKSNPTLAAKFQQRLQLFLTEPNHPILRNHKLTGNKLALSAFSVTGDIRIIYKIAGDTLLLVDVGSHNQVY